jgi:rhodanese-related sulfurtransferase
LITTKEKTMRKRLLQKIVLGAACCVLSVVLTAAAEEGFPLREKFPKVKYISTEALNRDYQNTIIVDVRSKIEYDVIHINKAVHVPITTTLFIKDLAKVRDKDGKAPMAFYCNGHTCAKSYEAAEQAMEAGFRDVYVYDAGIYDWVKAYPDKGTLMGKTPVPVNKLISHEMLAKKKINYDEFKKKTQNPGAMVIDIREPFQRDTIPQLPMLRNIPSDRFAELLKKGEFKDKELLILDAVGKQVEWIQYYLDMYGYKNYYFLDKGVLSAK